MDFSRFITEDPAKNGDDWYGYCYNNPTNYVDPSGKVPISEPWLFGAANCYVYSMNLKGHTAKNPGDYSGTNAYMGSYSPTTMANTIIADAAALGMSAAPATEEQIQGKNLAKNQWVIMAFGASAPSGAKPIDFAATSENGKSYNPATNSDMHYVQNPDGSITFYILQNYHFYRQNGDGAGNFNGTWSHKPGERPVSFTDSSGNIITNPRNANKKIVIEKGTFKFTGQSYEVVVDYGQYLGSFVITGNPSTGI